MLPGALLVLSGLMVAVHAMIEEGFRPLVLARNAEYVPDKYIVVLKEGLADSDLDQHIQWVNQVIIPTADQFSVQEERQYGIKDVFNFEHADFKGYFGEFPLEIVNALRTSDQIDYIEPDMVIRAQFRFRLSEEQQEQSVKAKKFKTKTTSKSSSSSSSSEEDTIKENAVTAQGVQVEQGAPWGLARISHRRWSDEETHTVYPYYENAGENVTVYVIDTGCNVDHVDLEGRAKWGITTVEEGDFDGNGHGSHVSGTIAGARYGVAKKATIVAVKVLTGEGSGSTSSVLKGIEWAAKDHKERVRSGKNSTKSVANMSLGGGKSRILDRAVDAAVEAGIHFAVAAGNENQDACNVSPAGSELAITVGATDIYDKKASFSNWGKCVDIFAPGKNILSIWKGSQTATNTISGTSMASPHVAGVLASYLSREEYANMSTTQLKDVITKKLSTRGVISGLIGRWGTRTKNRLVYTSPPKDV